MSREQWDIKELISEAGNGSEMYMIRGHVPDALAIEMIDHYSNGFYKEFGEPNIERTWTKPVPDGTGNCLVIYHTVDPKKCKTAMAVTFVTFD
ncbi:hypothetical protein BM892_002747 [Escherichia coli]|nr:hypothetical protein [Escherichia coli]